MPRVRITEFGGVAPSVSARDLPPTAAQAAENVELRYGDFRPLKGTGSSVTTVSSSTLSLHRTPSGTWLSSTNDVDYVNGQINDSSVERVYLTGRSAYPEVWQSGSYRRLGVRKPATPTVTVNVTDEFTQADATAASAEFVQLIKDSMLDNLTQTLLGGGTPTTGWLGGVWLTHGAVSDMPTTTNNQVVYAVPLTSGAATAASDQYLLDPLLVGKEITYSSAQYWAIPITWRPFGYDIDEATLATDIKAFMKPPENTEQLVPDAVADAMAARIAKISDPTVDPLLTLVARVNSIQADVQTFLSRGLTDGSRVYSLINLLQRLAAAIRTVDNYFVAAETPLGLILNDYGYLAPEVVERIIDTRVYVYTYVTDRSEESEPSLPSDVVEVDQNDSTTVTIPSPPSDGVYGPVTHWRLYRSSTTNDGADYQLVAETVIGTLTYTDEKLQEELLETCPSLVWTEPRSDMIGLCGGSNGIMVGFSGNVLCACVPFMPYAWPREYEMSFAHDIVAVKSIGQSFIVLTEGDTHLVSGSDSATLSSQQLPRPQACSSKRSAVASAGAVLFASPDGICSADAGGVTILTSGAYDQTDWLALTPSASFAAFSEGVYHLWLSTAAQRVSLDFGRVNLTVTPGSTPTGAYTDLLTDTLYVASGTTVLPMFRGSYLTGLWTSAIFVTPQQPSFAWAMASGPFSTATITIYADGASVLVVTAANNVPFRMPAVRGREWYIKFQSTGRISEFVMATSAAELRVD